MISPGIPDGKYKSYVSLFRPRLQTVASNSLSLLLSVFILCFEIGVFLRQSVYNDYLFNSESFIFRVLIINYPNYSRP